MKIPSTTRVLVIDDLFGRVIEDAPNRERINLCGKLLLADTGAAPNRRARQIEVKAPIAQAVFCRGQTPSAAGVGATVENDVLGTLAAVRAGWTDALACGAPPWAMVLLDLCFYTGRVTEQSHRRTPGMPEGRAGDDDPQRYFGLTLLDAIHSEFPELPVAILSSKAREEVSLEFSRRGAVSFIARDDARAAELLAEMLWQHGLLSDPDEQLIGHSLPILLALRDARRAACHRENLLIRGERGTGKELLAGYVHRTGTDDEADMRPFVTVNSAVLTPSLSSAELFGIEPRTATGVEGKIGVIEAADRGDLFFDEIADMPVEVQAALLRVLQERRVTRVGARQARTVNVRFLAATNADLENDARRFRPDLLDRLRIGGEIWLPPLRERKADIALLAERFVREAERQRPGIMRRQITPEALDYLCSHDWPGNVRELRACVFDAVNRHPDVEYLVPAHLQDTVAYRQTKSASQTKPASTRAPRQPEAPKAALSGLLQEISKITFPQEAISQWAGRLAEIQRCEAWLLARYLQAALLATKRRTSACPEGVIQIHPSVKLMTGDPSVSASKAADLVKRLLGPIQSEIDGDLMAAYQIAVRLRPKSGRRDDA